MSEEINESINEEHTLYCIYLQLTEVQPFNWKTWMSISFERGTYIYVGSAKRNIVNESTDIYKLIKNSIGILIISGLLESLQKL